MNELELFIAATLKQHGFTHRSKYKNWYLLDCPETLIIVHLTRHTWYKGISLKGGVMPKREIYEKSPEDFRHAIWWAMDVGFQYVSGRYEKLVVDAGNYYNKMTMEERIAIIGDAMAIFLDSYVTHWKTLDGVICLATTRNWRRGNIEKSFAEWAKLEAVKRKLNCEELLETAESMNNHE